MLLNTNVEICEENVPRLCREVWNKQVSHRPIEEINAGIEELLDRVITAPPTNSSDPECLTAVKYTSFTESSSQWRLLFMQMLITLPGESILVFLRNRLLSPNLATSGGFSLRIFLSLISTIVVCCKKGTSLIINFLHDILLSIFSSIPTKSADGSSSQPPDLAALLDDSLGSLVSQSQNASNNASDPVELKFTQLYHVLIIVRQVCVEDNRLTAFSYGQWWRENFSSSPVPQKEGSSSGGVLATRRSLELLSSLLTRFLPFERSPVHLSAQLAAPAPFWTITKEKEKSGEEECCRAWNAYLDVARGRLVELRMERGNETPVPSVNEFGWPSEVESLVEDFMKISSNATDPEKKRLPSALVEMHLFRNAFLRDTVLPQLRNPPLSIPEEKRVACGVLLHTIETRLLFRSTDSNSDRPLRSPKKNVRGKRARPWK